MKFKEKLLENDFGAYLYDLRMKHEYTVEELVERRYEKFRSISGFQSVI